MKPSINLSCSTFLANNHYTRGDEVPSIGNLIKSIRIPGFNVYRIVFNRDNTGNYDNVKPSPKLIQKPIPDNYADKQLFKSEIEKRNHSEARNINEINQVSPNNKALSVIHFNNVIAIKTFHRHQILKM